MAGYLFRNTRALALGLMLIFTMGISGLMTIGRQEDPTITNLFATVLTPYPGADPARVEALVTEKIEAELREIAAISELTSVSRTGLSVIQIELDELIPDGEIETAWADVRNALDDAMPELPPGVPEPEFRNDGTGTYTAISALMQPQGATSDRVLLGRLGDELQDRLRQLPGTEKVDAFGVIEREILVEIDESLLTGLGLSASDVSNAIAAADAKIGAGTVRGPRTDLVVELSGEITELERVRAVPLGPDAALRVADIASVRFVEESPPDSLAYYDGHPAVLVAARMAPGLQVDTWMQSVRGDLATFEASLPGGVEHRLIFDQSTYTIDRFADLATNLGIGIGLVTVVLFLTLGLRAALVVASAIPLAALISVYGMKLAGIPIHQMSVTGMIVALGLLVDAAIVMTDAIGRALRAGSARAEAIARSVRHLAVPLLASTLTTVLAFVPMAALPGPAGDFVGAIAKSVMIMLVASFALALTITPALAGHVLPEPADAERPRRWWRDGVRLPRLSRAFAGSLELALRHPGLAIVVALGLPVTGFLAFPTLTAQFFPGVDRNQFHVQMRLAGTPSIDVTDADAAEADAILRDTDGVTAVAWVVGESAPAFYYNMTMDQDGVSGFAEALVTTASPEATVAAIPELQARLNTALPQAQVIVRDLVQGPPVAAPVEVRFVGPDLTTLRALGDRTRAMLAEVPGITQIRATRSGGAPKLRVDLEEDRVRLAGLDLGRVARDLEANLDGTTGGSLVQGPDELPVRVRLGAEDRAGADRIADLQFTPPGATAAAGGGAYPGVPLTALGTVSVVPSDSPIDRRNGERINLVQAFVTLGTLPEEALGALRDRLAAEPALLPPGYRLEFGGDADARADTVNNLTATLALVATLTLATLVLAFGSFRLTLITLIVAVLAAGLSILALAIFRYPFGINALLGVIGSIGVSINAAIIVLSALREDEAASAGDTAAMRDVVMGASRHIVSTTVTTVGGFLPLILAGGGFWPPFAMAIAGGVLLSTVVAFYFTPPMFALLMPPRRRATDHAMTPTPQATTT